MDKELLQALSNLIDEKISEKLDMIHEEINVLKEGQQRIERKIDEIILK